jgi:U3 small nucleolar RNA-associated protein 15
MAGPESSAAPRLLAGSLDGHVKIFELDTFRVTHASKYPAPVLSLGLSKDCSTLAVGTADGMLSVRKHARPRVVEVSGWRVSFHGTDYGTDYGS